MKSVVRNATRRRESHQDSPSWLEIYAAIFSVLGAVATLGWLYEPGRDLSSLPAYFDLWSHWVIAIVLLGMGGGLALLATSQPRAPNRSGWVLASKRVASVVFGTAVLFAVVVPVVIWVVKLLIWVLTVMSVAAGLWAWGSLSRGRLQRLPCTPMGSAYWIRKALPFVPFGG